MYLNDNAHYLYYFLISLIEHVVIQKFAYDTTIWRFDKSAYNSNILYTKWNSIYHSKLRLNLMTQ